MTAAREEARLWVRVVLVLAVGGFVALLVGIWYVAAAVDELASTLGGPVSSSTTMPDASPYDVLGRGPFAEVAVAQVPTPRSWEAPAWLAYGGWNDCPAPAVHVAMLHRWHESHGVVLVGSSHDVVELHVDRPITDRAAALAMTTEHFAYCSDSVDHGVEGLAASLLDQPVWGFWWD